MRMKLAFMAAPVAQRMGKTCSDFAKKEARKLNKLKYILFDVDDTVTNGGKLTGEAYAAMWKLKEHGFKLIPVTAGPQAGAI